MTDDDDNRCYHCLTKYPLINRWAAFTDDELTSLTNAFHGDIWGTDLGTIEGEITAELERRKTNP